MGKVEFFPGMANPLENELDKTQFSGDAEQDFRIASRMEILSILRGITMHGTHICIHYGGDQYSIMTRAIGLDEHGMWLDASWFAPQDIQLLSDGMFTFVSMHQQVKIQFDAEQAVHGLFRDQNALYLEWPSRLLRMQRREFFRSPVPPSVKASCIIPIEPEDGNVAVRAAHLVDISGGGVRLLCSENDTALLPNRTFPDCRISLPDADPLTVTIEVRNSSRFTTADNTTYKRVGCRFVDLGNQTDILLQRHITRLQGENMSRRRGF